MTTVFGFVERPGGTAAEEVSVIVDLFVTSTDPDAPGFIPADQTEIFDRAILETGSTDNDWAPGYFEIDLAPTAAGDNVYDTDGLIYKVVYTRAGSQGTHYIDVPASPTPVWIGNIITPAPPPPVPPGLIATLDDLTDVVITNPTTGQILTFDGTDWVNGPPGGTGVVVLDDIADVDLDIPNLATGDVLSYDLSSGMWQNELTVRTINGLQGDVTFDAAGIGAVPLTDAGIPGGYPVLDGLGIIPTSFLPDFVSTVNGTTGAVTLDAVDIPLDTAGFVGLLDGTTTELQALAAVVDSISVIGSGLVDSVNGDIGTVVLNATDVGAVDLTAVGAPDGVAPLDATSRVPLANMPPLVTSIDGLTGDIILDGTMVAIDASTYNGGVLDTTVTDVQLLANFIDNLGLTNSGLVDSVNGQIGTVVLTGADIPIDGAFFGGNLTPAVNDAQKLAEAVNALDISSAVDSVNGQIGAVVLTADGIGALDADLYGAAFGVATLDIDGLLPFAQLPPVVLSINSLTGAIDLSGEMVALDNTDFAGNLDASITDVQLLAAAVDALTISPPTGPVTSVNSLTGIVVLAAADVGAVDLTAVGAIDGVAPLDGVAMVPTTNLPDVVFSVNSLGGVVDLLAASIPLDDSGFSDNLVGVTDVQGFADIFDTFAGGGGGGGHTLKEAGSALTQRANMNFLAGFDLADNSGTTATDVSLDLTEYQGGALALTSGGTGAITAPLARTNLAVYSTTEVDNLINTTAANVGKRVSVTAATTANITIATALNNGDTLDGVTLATGNLVLVKNQTAPAENGIYVVGVSPARDANFDTWADYPSSLASVVSGTAGALTVWLCTSNTGGTLGTTAITYSQIATGGGTMAAQNANNVAITGGSITGLTSMTVAQGAFSAGALLTGHDTASGYRSLQNITITSDPTDIAIGSPFYIESLVELNYEGLSNPPLNNGVGPMPYTNNFGPRSQFHVEGRHQYHYRSSFGGLPSPTYGAFMRYKNYPATLDASGDAWTMCPGWGYISANVYQADAAAVGLLRHDLGTTAADFVANTVFMTSDGGSFAEQGHVTMAGFLAEFYALGNTHLSRRTGLEVDDINTYPIDFTIPLDPYLRIYGETAVADPLNYIVDEQRGIDIHRLVRATRNIGIRCDTPVELWADTNTFTVAPPSTVTSIIQVGGTHTYNYTGGAFGGPNVSVYEAGGTWNLSQVGSAFGFWTGLNFHPVIQNTTAFAPSPTQLISNNTMVSVNPTYRAVSHATAFGDIFSISSAATFDTSFGTSTVATYTDFVSQLTVGSGVTVAQRYGFRVSAATNSGTITATTGLYIEALGGSPTTGTYGIVNLNASILQGVVYGGFLTGSHLQLRTNGDTNPTGTIKFDNPRTSFIVSNVTLTSAWTMADATGTVTMNASSNNRAIGFNFAPTISFSQAGSGFGQVSYQDVATYKNTVGSGNIGFTAVTSFEANPTITADTATITGSYYGFDSGPITAKLTSGSLTLAEVGNFTGSLTVGTGTTVTSRYGLKVNDPTGSGVVTTNIGIDIAALAKGGTANIGFRNASTTVFPEGNAQTVASAGAIIDPSTTVIRLNNTTAGSVTLTSQPHILDGQNDQIIVIYNSSAQNVVLQDQGTRAGSNVRLQATTITLTPRDSVMMMYSTTVGDWIQLTPVSAVI